MQPIGKLYLSNLADEANNFGSEIGYALKILRQDPEKNAPLTEQILKLESNRNNTAASYLLGLLYLQGYGKVEQNVAEAIALFNRIDTHQSNHTLGVLYLQGLYGVPKDVKEGMRHLKRASTQGSTTANIVLGIIYWAGVDGYPQKSDKAQQFLRSMVEGSNYEAYWCSPELKKLSVESKRVLVDYAFQKATHVAGRWIEHLPEAEQAHLFCRLGDRLWSKGGQTDFKKAADAWTKMEKAIPKNRPLTDLEKRALCHVGRAWYHLREKSEQNYTEAVRLWQRAAEAGHPMAHYYLGLAYCSGKGVKKDLEKGKAELKMAAEQQFQPACAMLNRLEKKELKPLQPVADNPLQLPPHEEKDVIEANDHFLGKAWTWIKKHSVSITITLITAAAIAALVAGLVALTFFFPHVMVPIWVVAGVATFGGGFMLLAFAAGSGDKGAQRALRHFA